MDNKIATVAYGAFQMPLKIGSFEVGCYITSDMQRVLSIASIQVAFGYEGKSEFWLLAFLNSIHKFSRVSSDLLDAYTYPLKLEVKNSKGSHQTIGVIDCNLFVATCKIILDAKNEGLLNLNNLKASKTAQLFLQKVKEQPLQDLIDIATGYYVFKEHVKVVLVQFLQEKLNDDIYQWIKTFPDSFYNTLFKIHDIEWKSIKTNPQVIGKLLHDIIFSRLSEDLLEALRTIPPKRIYSRKGGKPEHLEHPELKVYLSSIMALLNTSGDNWFIFLQLLNRTHPVTGNHKTTFPLMPENAPGKTEGLSSFNFILKKMT